MQLTQKAARLIGPLEYNVPEDDGFIGVFASAGGFLGMMAGVVIGFSEGGIPGALLGFIVGALGGTVAGGVLGIAVAIVMIGGCSIIIIGIGLAALGIIVGLIKIIF